MLLELFCFGGVFAVKHNRKRKLIGLHTASKIAKDLKWRFKQIKRGIKFFR